MVGGGGFVTLGWGILADGTMVADSLELFSPEVGLGGTGVSERLGVGVSDGITGFKEKFTRVVKNGRSALVFSISPIWVASGTISRAESLFTSVVWVWKVIRATSNTPVGASGGVSDEVGSNKTMAISILPVELASPGVLFSSTVWNLSLTVMTEARWIFVGSNVNSVMINPILWVLASTIRPIVEFGGRLGAVG
jgi:hypothetical protein